MYKVVLFFMGIDSYSELCRDFLLSATELQRFHFVTKFTSTEHACDPLCVVALIQIAVCFVLISYIWHMIEELFLFINVCGHVSC